MDFVPVLAIMAVVIMVGGGIGVVALAWSFVAKQVTVRELFTVDAFDAFVAFSPDGRTLATGTRGPNPASPGELKLWDVATGEQQATLMGHSSGIAAVAFSPDGQTLATGGLDNMVKLWDVVTREEQNTLRGHRSFVGETVFSPDGKRLATGSGGDPRVGSRNDNETRLWDVQTAEELEILRFQNVDLSDIYALAFSPDGKLLATGSGSIPTGRSDVDGRVTLWDLATGEEQLIHVDREGSILAVAFSPDGRMLASGGFTRGTRLWDVASGEQLLALPRQGNWVYALAFSPDGKILATGTGSAWERSSRGRLTLWDAERGTMITNVDTDGHGVMSIAFSPDGKHLAAGMFSGNAKIFSITGED